MRLRRALGLGLFREQIRQRVVLGLFSPSRDRRGPSVVLGLLRARLAVARRVLPVEDRLAGPLDDRDGHEPRLALAARVGKSRREHDREFRVRRVLASMFLLQRRRGVEEEGERRVSRLGSAQQFRRPRSSAKRRGVLEVHAGKRRKQQTALRRLARVAHVEVEVVRRAVRQGPRAPRFQVVAVDGVAERRRRRALVERALPDV
mmetsp:Transcript_37049/g.113337  ORF Transcript_37049/g.113337 Transcript_37049/m.113337 type:complete len:204 (+) Transcript_37049:429-1040(+)